MLPTGFRSFHFVSFLYVFFFFSFLLFRFFSHYLFLVFCVSFFFFVSFRYFSHCFLFVVFLFLSFRFFLVFFSTVFLKIWNHQYKNPLRNIVVNYNEVTSDPDILNSVSSSCSCVNFPFIYPPVGHACCLWQS